MQEIDFAPFGCFHSGFRPKRVSGAYESPAPSDQKIWTRRIILKSAYSKWNTKDTRNSKLIMAMKDINVIVVGAGFGGLASAIALSRKGCKVIVFESSRDLTRQGM